MGLRASDDNGSDAEEDDAHDHHHREHLDQAVNRLSPEAQAAQSSSHFVLASTSASALRATSSLFLPMPQRRAATWSAAISSRSASAPCHQPKDAPVTIQACWKRKWRTLAEVGLG